MSAKPFDPTMLTRYGRLAIVARTVVEGFLTGLHHSPYKGFSVEFAEHRQYYPGDEIRHIDWRAYGKTDRPYIKEYEEETNLQAHLLLDASGSMAFGGPRSPSASASRLNESKFDYARHVAASIAYLMLHQLDAVGLLVHDTKVRERVPAHASTKHLLHLFQVLEKATPGGETSMAHLWHSLANQLPHRGMIIILSDCFDNLAMLLQALRHFRHGGHEVILFHILAPEEIEFPFRKWTQFRNLERAGDKLLVDPQRLREEYLKNFTAFCDELRKQAGLMQVDYHLLRTDESVDRALGHYLSRRSLRK